MNTSNTCRLWISMSTGAYRAERMTSSKKLAATPMTPPPPRRMRLDSSARIRPSIFGISSTIMLNQNNAIISSTSNRGQDGKQLKVVVEILGADQVRLHRERKADAEHHQPQRRGQVAHDADAQMQPAGEAQARGADDLHVLQIALSPAPVADGDVDERGRGFFPGAAAVGGHAHLPAAAAHQRRLDEVVRQHEAAEGLAARERAAGRSSARTRRRG